METLTIFTPSYNRANLLPQLYSSLCRQTSDDFLWLVIDDGSTDNTKELIESWQKDSRIKIKYFYKQNGGMHTGHNAAYRLIDTELNVCIDSDDFMPDDAVEKIINFWSAIPDKSDIAGIVGLDADTNNNIIGTKIPENLIRGSFYDLYYRYNVKGDKKLVLRTDIVKKYPEYPEYEKEKLVPLGILYLMIGQDYDYVYTNETFCIVDYQNDGSSNTILKQYKQSPNGFAYSRIIRIKYEKSLKEQFKHSIHLVSSVIFSKNTKWLRQSEKPLILLCSVPFGILLNIYIRLKTK